MEFGPLICRKLMRATYPMPPPIFSFMKGPGMKMEKKMEAPEADKKQFVSAQNAGNGFLEFKFFLWEHALRPR